MIGPFDEPRSEPRTDPPSGAAQSGEGETRWELLRPALALCFLLIGTNALLLASADQHGDVALSAQCVVLAIDALLIGVCVWHERTAIARALLPHFPSGSTVGLVVLTFLVLLVVGEAYFFVVSQIATMFEYLSPYREQGWPLWSAVAMIIAYPAVFEELAFRGYLQGRLERAMSARDALILQAALFSILHLSPLVLPSHFFIGLALGLLRNRTGSLWPGMALHAAWNTWVLVPEL